VPRELGAGVAEGEGGKGMKYLWCLIVGHDTGRAWYWDAARCERYRDFQYCERCKCHL